MVNPSEPPHRADNGRLNQRRFGRTLPKSFCGCVIRLWESAGSVATYNTIFDTAFTFKTLLAPDTPLSLVQYQKCEYQRATGPADFEQAQQTPQGRARLALVAAMMDESGRSDPQRSEPAPSDAATRLANQLAMLQSVGMPFAFGDGRVDIEQRAGGDPSWNTGVNYSQLLTNSRNRDRGPSALSPGPTGPEQGT